jgi:hypothetical protein
MIVGHKQDFASATFRVEHRNAHDMACQRPKAELALNFQAADRSGGGIGDVLGLAKEIFLLHRVEMLQRLRCGFNIEDELGQSANEDTVRASNYQSKTALKTAFPA